MVHWSNSFILGQGWLLSNHFCKACQNCLRPSFVRVHNAVLMHELLLCCESSCKCHHAAQTTPTCPLNKLHNWLLCSHPWPKWMNNVPNESRIIICHHALKSVLLYLFFLFFWGGEILESNLGFLFFVSFFYIFFYSLCIWIMLIAYNVFWTSCLLYYLCKTTSSMIWQVWVLSL